MTVHRVVPDDLVGDTELVRGAVGAVTGVFLYCDVGPFERLLRRDLRENRGLGNIDRAHASVVYGTVELLAPVAYVHYAVTDAFVEIQAVVAVWTVLAGLSSSTEYELLTDIGE